MKKTILYLSLAFVAFLYGQTQLNWNTQLRNRPNITRVGANSTWTDNVTMSGTNTLSGPNVITGTDTGTQTISGNKTYSGTNGHNGTENFGRLNAHRTAYAGNVFDTGGSCAGEMGCIINNAIKDIPDATPEGIIVEAFGGGTINTNPWATIGNRSGILYFGPGVWTINTTLQLPKAWKVEGYGRGGVADGKNTIIKAGGSFPASTPLFIMGVNPVDNGVQIRNLGVDCQNVSGAIGIQNTLAQEQSVVEHVLIVNCPGNSLSIGTSSAQNSGPYSDIEILNFSCSNCSASTVPISVGSGVSFFRGIHGATVNSNGVTFPTAAIRIDSGGTFTDLHIEEAVSSIVIGSIGATSAVVVSNVGCGPMITDCVKISNNFATQNIHLSGIYSSTGNLVTDQILGNTLTQAGEGGQVALYVTGNGSPPGLTTTSANFGNILNNWSFYKERAAPSSSVGYETCYGDSTSHTLKCGFNGLSGGTMVGTLCSTSQKTETAADTNLLTCSIQGVAGSYRIRFILVVGAANAATLGWTATWTDSNGNARTPTNLSLFQEASAAPALTFTTSATGTYYGYIDIDVNNSGTAIVVKSTFSGTSFTGKATASVERIL